MSKQGYWDKCGGCGKSVYLSRGFTEVSVTCGECGFITEFGTTKPLQKENDIGEEKNDEIESGDKS